MNQALLEFLTKDDFAQLRGLNISASVPLPQDLINQILTMLLQKGEKNPKTNVDADKALLQQLGFAQFLPLIRSLNVRVELGVVHVDIEIRV